MMEHLSNNSLPQQLAIIDGPSTSAQAAAALAAAASVASAATSNAAPANSANGGIHGSNSIINGGSSISEGNATNFHGGNGLMLNSGNSFHMSGGHSFQMNGANSLHAGISSINYSLNGISLNSGNSLHTTGGNTLHTNGGNSFHSNGSNSLHLNGSNSLHLNGGNSLHLNGGNSLHLNGGNNYKLNGCYNNNGGNSNNIHGGNRFKINGYHNTNGGHNVNSLNGGNSYGINAGNSNIMNGGNSLYTNGGNGFNGGVHLNAVNGVHMNAGNGVHMNAGNGVHMNVANGIHMNSGNGIHMNVGNSVHMTAGNGIPMNGGNNVQMNGSNSYNGGNNIIMNGGNSNSYFSNGATNMPITNGYTYGAHNIISTSVFNHPNGISNTRHINFTNVGLIGELAELTAYTNIPVPDIGLTISTVGGAAPAIGNANYSGTNSSTASHSSDRGLPSKGAAYPEGAYQPWDANTNGLLPNSLRNIVSPPPPPPRNDCFMTNFLAAVEQQNQQLQLQKEQQKLEQQKQLEQQQQQQNLQKRKQQQQHHNQVLFNQPPPAAPPQHQPLVAQNDEEEEEEGAVGGAPAPVAVIAPIGTGPRNSARTSPDVFPNVHINVLANGNIDRTYICEVHNELYRYVCDFCRKLVCQCCTLHEHKDHCYISINSFLSGSKDKLKNAINSSQTGTKCIKSSIDKALGFIRLVERNCTDIGDTIRKAYRNFISTVEDRERYMLDFVDKLRQRRLALLHDQMAGLKSALAGLAETSEMLNQAADHYSTMDEIELALKLTNGQRQMEQFASIYKDLQPKNENMAFINPDYHALSDVRIHGGICYLDDDNKPIQVLSSPNSVEVSLATMTIGKTPVMILTPNGRAIVNEKRERQAYLQAQQHNMVVPIPPRSVSANGMTGPKIEWELPPVNVRTSPGLYMNAPRATQAVPGSSNLVYARHSGHATISFAGEGHEDGQVSRPWGICVDKFGNILVSDRRNNRVQVFSMDGSLKFKFGRKGVNNGEFDLPAGICVDIDNRIIVVDKDNHRVQIFTSTGIYLNKFGSYGKEYGQFQYPWDVAVNTRRQIAVTDSRNHRIQQFDSEGRFIRQIVFDNHGQTKGIASPRGICYTPTGNIIVSDFDNHCLYLIDPDASEVISTKGHEGSSFHEFNRPSGLCCDDEGRIIVADSKNQRVLVFNSNLDFLWDVEVRPSLNPKMPSTLDEKDRTCDVAVMPDGRIVFLIELSPDSKEGSNPFKRFVHIC